MLKIGVSASIQGARGGTDVERQAFGRGLARRLALIALAIVPSMLAPAGPANAYTTASGYVAQDYATGFQAASYGPIGIAFDQSDNLYVADSFDGHIYR